jgi:uncharacterized protein (TIGR02118 family)
MIKVIAPALRHPTNRTLEDFHRYWGDTHGPLFNNTRTLRRYVQHLTLPEAYGGDPAPTFDGVSMFWYDELADRATPTNDPEILALLEPLTGVKVEPPPAGAATADDRDVELLRAVLKDDAQLFDRSTTWPMHHKRAMLAAREVAIVDGASAPEMVKAIFIASKLPGLTHLEFFDRWQHHHGRLVARLPGLRRYVQNHALLEGYPSGGHTHDGWAELWFDDLTALRAAVDSPQWREVVDDGETLFGGPLGVGVARERVQKDERWTYHDWGASALSDDEIGARLAEQGYTTLAGEPGVPRAIRDAASREALAVWTSEHLVTIDASRIDVRPER